ncbi:type II toxin-antitoxin system Phd/YefM family antitoxin [Enterovirga rhinocerotis]|uniref:Antitoxin n=1 Tax=Enterovirga rhinocerotis TaxID=1339210 RepID=A0A4R7C7Z7_9HYPH|nr:type II toxin-antitoxin system prevent-host-death family antitoxin [Enterovirga rhinocerotis]TDR94451.1 prevent-host-death family protein [Enterovirga rhinocerotis]
MATITIHEAKTQLSKLIARAEAGEDIVIARGKEPVVRLVLVEPKAPVRKGGWLKHLPELPDSVFFDPLPEEELRLWEGHGPDPNDPPPDPDPER